MAALTALLGGPAVGAQIMTSGGLVLLWLAAALTLWTGYDYLKAGIATALER
jgi:phosphatidylglycerophosphate synthase